MCQACYDKGYKDYPEYNSSVAHIEDYKRGYKTKQNESLDADELQHTFFCEKCYQRGLSNNKNGIWAPPFSTKRGHYESYEKGYNQVEVIEETKIPEYYLPEEEKSKIEKQAPIDWKKYSKIIGGVVLAIACIYAIFKLTENPAQPAIVVPVQDTAPKPIVNTPPQTDTTPKPKEIEKQAEPVVAKSVDTPKAVAKPPVPEAKSQPVKPAVPEKETKKPEIKKEEKKQPEPSVVKETHSVAGSSSANGKYPQTSQKVITATDLKGLSKQELKLMRNEIFARHGYIFKSPDMEAYFKQQSWYQGKYNDVNSKLSPVERQNVDFIKSQER